MGGGAYPDMSVKKKSSTDSVVEMLKKKSLTEKEHDRKEILTYEALF